MWNDFEAESFVFEERDAVIIRPNCEPNGHMLLKTEYLDAFPKFDTAMLERGYYLIFIHHRSRWAPDEETDIMARFVRQCAKRLGACERCILGFWTWRGGPDEAMRAFMEKLHGKSVFFFATMAAFPDSPHAARCALRTQALLESRDCRVLGHFFCQGRLDSAVLARSTHPRTPERMARLAEAALHPDERDFSAAARAVERALFSASPSGRGLADAAALKRSA